MSDWQPIESAPKDGSKFWGFCDGDAISMFWHPAFGEFVTRFNRMTLAEGMTFADTGESFRDHSPEVRKPRFWMPIAVPALERTDAR